MAREPRELDAATKTQIRNLEEKTGKSLDEWLATARGAGVEKHGQIVAHLKSEHGLTHGYANLVALLARGYGEESGDGLIDAQYAGAKAGLRPIYEKVAAAVKAFGADVEIAPKKTSVSFRRSKQFALAQPSTKTRVDLGIQLKGVPPEGRLEPSGPFGTMCSHRVRLESPDDVDEEVVAWLRRAYDAA
jgi:predicted transport protein